MSAQENDKIVLLIVVVVLVATSAIVYSLLLQPPDVRERLREAPGRELAPDVEAPPFPKF